jgi:TetR/AcrR family transcriptional repressor of nem operon
MRYVRGDKRTTRQRILEVASTPIPGERDRGDGDDRDMAGSGLTNGAFYSHFTSKDDLIRAARTRSRNSTPISVPPVPTRVISKLGPLLSQP